MQRAVFEEDVFEQFGRRRGVHNRAGGDDLAQALLALEHDQHAGFGLGHIRTRGNGRVDRGLGGVRVVRRDQQAADIALAQLLEQTAQLGLEDDDRGRNANAQRVAQDERNRVEPCVAGDQEDEQQPDDTLGQARRARILEQLHQAVDDVGDNQDIDDIHRPCGPHCVKAVDDGISHIIEISGVEKVQKCIHIFTCPVSFAFLIDWGDRDFSAVNTA